MLTFGDERDIETQHKVMDMKTMEEIRDFILTQTDLIFILDQYNAVEIDDVADPLKEEKKHAQDLLSDLTVGQVCIKAASANNSTSRRMRERQSGTNFIEMVGGMNEVTTRTTRVRQSNTQSVFHMPTLPLPRSRVCVLMCCCYRYRG